MAYGNLIGAGRKCLELFGSLAVVPNVVFAQYQCAFQRDTIYHTIEPKAIQRENVSAGLPTREEDCARRQSRSPLTADDSHFSGLLSTAEELIVAIGLQP